MIKFKLTTYREGKDFKGSYFYILNKGNNSGKPLLTPCPNCFVCQCTNEEEKQELYWLMYGMWQGKAIYPHLIGSVIPFIRLKELSKGELILENPDELVNTNTLLRSMGMNKKFIPGKNKNFKQKKKFKKQ